MPLNAGSRLGPYEVIAPAGAGGMGEVYRARDIRLDRTVAIKVLPSDFAARDDLRQRFDREARTVGGLNHPNICALYDIGQQGSVDYLVMEYIEGETLASRLAKGPLPLDQALRYGIQIADALDRAHRSGVVHRDLKPANIMLTKDTAKLLDFGLAKVMADQAAVAGTVLATRTSPLTAAGTILGTFQYMAPEQLEGGEADARTDIFALGAVLYEMLTGRKAFEGKSQASLISCIMTAQPAPIAAVQPMTPPALEHVVRLCLEKDPEARWQTAHDVVMQLKWIAEGGSQAGSPAPVVARRRHREYLLWTVAAVSVLAAAACAALYWLRPVEEVRTVRFAAFPPEGVMFEINGPQIPALSPDGQKLVFAGQANQVSRLYVRSLDSLDVRVIPGTEGAWLPFWSPDSRSIGFFTTGRLKRVDVGGGPVQTICEFQKLAGFGAWNADGEIVFSEAARLQRVSAAGGKPEPVLELDAASGEYAQSYATFLPDGRRLLFVSRNSVAAKSSIVLVNLDDRKRHNIMPAQSNLRYSAPGYIIFGRGQTLFAQPFDSKRGVRRGDAFPIAEQVRTTGSLFSFSASTNGTLVFLPGDATQNRISIYDRVGKPGGTIGPAGKFLQISLSPDQTRLAVDRREDAPLGQEIWSMELATGIFSRLTFHGASEPVWSADGRQVIFRDETSRILRKTVGGGDEELVLKASEALYPEQSLPDGSLLLLNQAGKTFFRLPAGGDKLEAVLQSEFDKDEPAVSPDGHWIAYNSNESGQSEVYIAAYPSFTGRRQVSPNGGMQPQWRKDMKELFYLAPDAKIMAVPIGSGMTPAPAEVLFQTKIQVIATRGQYAVTNSGQKFWTVEPMQSAIKPMTVVLNWTAGLSNRTGR